MSVGKLVKSIQNIMRQDVGVDGDAQRISQLCWMFFLKIIDDQDQELETFSDGYRSPVPAPLRWRNWAKDPEGITGEDLLDFVNGDLFPQLKELPARSGPRASVVRGVFADAYNYMKSGHLLRQVVNKINGIDFNNLADRRHFGDIYEQMLNDLQSAGNAGEYYTPRAVTTFMVRMTDPRPGETLLDPACGTGGYASIGTNLLFFEKGDPTRDVWFWEHLVPEGQKAYSMTRPIRVEHLDDCAKWWGGRERTDRAEGGRAWKVSVDEIEARGYNLDFKNPHTPEEDLGDPEALLKRLNSAEADVASVRDELKRILTEALLQ